MGDSAKWLRKQRDALTSGVSRVVDEFNGDLEKELNRRDQEKKSLLEHISTLVTVNSRLATENNHFRNQAVVAIQPRGLSSHASGPRTKILEAQNEILNEREDKANAEEDRIVPYRDFADLTEKYNALRSQNHETEKALREIQRRYEAMKEKYQAVKERVKEWQRYTKHQLAKKAALNSKTATTSSTTSAVEAVEDEGSPTSTSSTPRASLNGGTLSLSISPRLPASSSFLSPRVPLNAEKRLRPLPDAPADLILVNTPHGFSTSALLQETDNATSHHTNHEPTDLPMLRDYRTQELCGGFQAISDHLDVAQGTSSLLGGLPASEMMSSSQTTEDETAGAQRIVKGSEPIVTAECDDGPEFVSARSLKRKRQHLNKIEVPDESRASDGIPARPIRIKEENSNSLPQTTNSPQKLTRKETLDLDELGSKIATPRKRRLRIEDCLSLHSTVLGNFRHERSTSLPIVKGEALAENNLQIDTDDSPAMLTSSDHGPDVKIEGRANSEPPSSQQILPGGPPVDVLHPLDPNVRVLPRTGQPDPQDLCRQKDEVRGGQKIRVLGEDGEDSPPEENGSTPNVRAKRSSPTAKAESTRRLRSLLEAPTLEKHALSTTRTSIVSKPRRHQHDGLDITMASAQSTRIQAQPELISKQALKHRRQGSSSRSGSRPGSRLGSSPRSLPGSLPGSRPGSRTDLGSSHTSLRACPLDQLTIADFKPNPAFNQGFNYTFLETVRGRDARRCLPGCTDPSCCGSAFRALAAAAPALPVPSRLFDDSQDDSDENERLLKDYLGGAYDVQRIRRMKAEEREELVLQAKTRLVADNHGKHRHAYERRVTPPGFWRTDMPSTQEIERDREAARELERKSVEERWRESMREGGRWLFRDE